MNATVFDSIEAVRDLEGVGVERAHAEVIAKTAHNAGMAGRGELATKTDLAAQTARLEMKYAALETKFAELKADVSATINRVIFSQIALTGALFAALKLF